MNKLLLIICLSTASVSAFADQLKCYYDYNRAEVSFPFTHIQIVTGSQELVLIADAGEGRSLNVIANKKAGSDLYVVNKEGTMILTQNTAMFLRYIKVNKTSNPAVDLQFDLGLGSEISSNRFNCQKI
jgi:hypothetical protein